MGCLTWKVVFIGHLLDQYCLWVFLAVENIHISGVGCLCSMMLGLTSITSYFWRSGVCVRKQNDSGWLLKVCSRKNRFNFATLEFPLCTRMKALWVFLDDIWPLKNVRKQLKLGIQPEYFRQERNTCEMRCTCLMDSSILRVWTGTDNCTDSILTSMISGLIWIRHGWKAHTWYRDSSCI